MLRTLPLCTCHRHYPGTATGITPAHSPSRISLPRYGRRVGLCIGLFEACSAFTRVTACTLAMPPYFVTPSPEASTALLPPQLLRLLPAGALAGWDSHPLGKRRLSTAHAMSRHSRPRTPSLLSSESCVSIWDRQFLADSKRHGEAQYSAILDRLKTQLSTRQPIFDKGVMHERCEKVAQRIAS